MKAQISPQDESLLSDIEVGGLSDGQQEGCDVDQTQTKSPCGRHAVVLSKLHFVCIGICFVVLLVLVVVVGISAAPTLHFSLLRGGMRFQDPVKPKPCWRHVGTFSALGRLLVGSWPLVGHFFGTL